MIKDVINYLNVKLNNLAYINEVLCLAEKIKRGDQQYPALYNGLNEYSQINLDSDGSTSYWRKNGKVSVTTETNNTQACPVQYKTTLPLKLVCFIAKDVYTNDQYFADNLANEFIGYLTTNNAALKGYLKAKKATVIATGYDTDPRSVASEEYEGVQFEARYTHAYFSIDFDLEFITNNQCYVALCEDNPLIFPTPTPSQTFCERVKECGIDNYNYSSTLNITSDGSSSDGYMSPVTLSPITGDYLVFFSSSLSCATANTQVEISVYVGGIKETSSVRFETLDTSNRKYSVSLHHKISVTTGQAVQIYWNTSNSAVATAHQKSLTLIKI